MKLTARKVSALTKVGLHGDGAGLWLKVTKSGSKSWVFRYTRNKKATSIGLGSILTVSLSQARTKASTHRQALAEGNEPLLSRQDNAMAYTFKECALRYIESHKSAWTNAKHAQQWTSSLADYAYPIMGDIPVKNIDEALILSVLTPIWNTKTETASRVRCRIENILSWAAVLKYRDRYNPAQWRGNLEHVLPKPSRVKKIKHHKAMPYADMHVLILQLRNHDSISARALEFLVLNANRTGEILGAVWSEIDSDVWIIPAERMKAGKEHRIALSSRSMVILEEMAAIRQSDYIFAGSSVAKGLGIGTMRRLLLALGHDCTVHGFRSTFRDWAAEKSNHSHEICEMALAHTIANKSEAAYRRGDLLEKRRALMSDWMRFLELPTHQKAKVIPIKSRA
jgi:integrase